MVFLDCMNGDLAYQSASGTAGISAAFVHISHNELKPGDVGLKFYGGSNGTQTNHVGIYVGKEPPERIMGPLYRRKNKDGCCE